VEERWADIPGYEGAYQISNYGRIRSLDRTRIVNNCHGGRTARTDKGHLMSPNNNGNGYLQIRLRNDGKKEVRYIHRLVAEAFCQKVDGCDEVNHKDHNKSNNQSDNLEWCNRIYNVNYSRERMKKPKSTCKKSSTGIKYLTVHQRGGRKAKYRVCVRNMGINREFKTIEEATAYLKEVMR
jgi:hypothetical protein